MIHCYVDQSQKNWHEQLSLLAAAYRSARNSSTGFTPNMLMLGREVHQPQDIWLGVAERRQGGKEPLEYVQDLEKSLNKVHEMARQHLKAAQRRQKRLHDLRAQQHSYNVGNLVYVRDSTKKKGFSQFKVLTVIFKLIMLYLIMDNCIDCLTLVSTEGTQYA